MEQNCCDDSFYRTKYNVNYQNLYCNLAQKSDTNISDTVTSGWSYNKAHQDVKENYCGCGFSRVYVDTPMAENYEPNYKFSVSPSGKHLITENYDARMEPDRFYYKNPKTGKFELGSKIKENYDSRDYPLWIDKDGKGGECPTNFLRTPYNIAYQKLYCEKAQKGMSDRK